MKTLYLLRHAEAEPAKGMADSDHGRLLSARGRIEARAVGDFMKTEGFLPQFIMGSDAIRTVSTARQVAEALFGNLKNPVTSRFDRRLYLAPAELLLSEIQALAGKLDQLLLVGHNPGLAELGAHLAGDGAHRLEGFAPATLAVIRSEAEDWALFDADNTTLVTSFTPNIA